MSEGFEVDTVEIKIESETIISKWNGTEWVPDSLVQESKTKVVPISRSGSTTEALFSGEADE